MSVSYDKSTREAAAKKGRTLATLAVAGLSIQVGVTPAEQNEMLSLYQKINKRVADESATEATATPAQG